MDTSSAAELVRRLAAAIRSAELYAASHPIVVRAANAFGNAAREALKSAPTVVIGFIGDEIVVDDVRLTMGTAMLAGFARDLRNRDIDKVVLSRGLTEEEARQLVMVFSERASLTDLADRLQQRGVRHVTLGRIVVEHVTEEQAGIVAAKRAYATATETAETVWDAAKAGDKPDPAAVRRIIDSLVGLLIQDRTSLMALTAMKKYDNYTFTHMVNVSTLAMAQARALNVEGDLLREFGFAALMHDIGKVNTPIEVLNKPDRLTKEEFQIMKRHVIDGAHILRDLPEAPALAPIVAFEHHLKQDLSGYPEGIISRDLNLCTMIVSIADVFDALRSTRSYREGLATARIRAIMSEQDNPAFNQRLLKRFVALVGLFPVGALVRLSTDELAVVTVEHPNDPFRPQVKVIGNAAGEFLEEPFLVNTWEKRSGEPCAVVEAVDPETLGIDPLGYL